MILIAAFRWSKITYFLHLLIGATIAFLTVYFSYTFIKTFLPNVRVAVKPKRQFMYNHKMIGLVLVFGMSFQVISGFITRFIRQSEKAHPNLCI
jgi:hypothetical protein